MDIKRKCAMCGGYFSEDNFRLKKRYLRGKEYWHRDCYCKNCSKLYMKEYQRIYRERRLLNAN
jgi:hypothetical protein